MRLKSCLVLVLLVVTLAFEARSAEPAYELQTDKIFPRLMRRDVVQQSGVALVSTSLSGTNLDVVYFLDTPTATKLLEARDLASLALSVDGLHKFALENLRKTQPALIPGVIKTVLDGQKPGAKPMMVGVQVGDSNEAARALLLPELLGTKDALVIVIPDRDTLVVVGKDILRNKDALDGLRVLARQHEKDPTVGKRSLGENRILKVTKAGFEVVPE